MSCHRNWFCLSYMRAILDYFTLRFYRNVDVKTVYYLQISLNSINKIFISQLGLISNIFQHFPNIKNYFNYRWKKKRARARALWYYWKFVKKDILISNIYSNISNISKKCIEIIIVTNCQSNLKIIETVKLLLIGCALRLILCYAQENR